MWQKEMLKVYGLFFGDGAGATCNSEAGVATGETAASEALADAPNRRAEIHAWMKERLQQACQDYGLGALPPLLTGEHGKPFLGEDFPLHFNLSHSGDGAALALSAAPVGLDMECRHGRLNHRGRRWEPLSKRFFSDEEQAFILRHKDELRPDVFLLLWTCKESLYKYIGCGLSQGLSQYTLQFDENADDVLILAANTLTNALATDALTADTTHTNTETNKPVSHLPLLKQVRASYEARPLYFYSGMVRHGENLYRLTVCSALKTSALTLDIAYLSKRSKVS